MLKVEEIQDEFADKAYRVIDENGVLLFCGTGLSVSSLWQENYESRSIFRRHKR